MMNNEFKFFLEKCSVNGSAGSDATQLNSWEGTKVAEQN